MSEASQPDESTFRLASGEELVLPGDNAALPQSAAGRTAPRGRPLRPARPSLRDRRAAKRLRARKVRRLVRHIEPWSVLKISLIFYFCLWIITLISGVILWNMAVSSGTIDNVENFIEELFALDSFEFNGEQIFRATAVGGLVLVVAGAGFTVLMAVLFNLISDITGGMRLTVVEEETARPRPRRTRPRRGVRPTPASEMPALLAPEGMVRVPETPGEDGWSGPLTGPGELDPASPGEPDTEVAAVTPGFGGPQREGRVPNGSRTDETDRAGADTESVGPVDEVEADTGDPQTEVATAPPDR